MQLAELSGLSLARERGVPLVSFCADPVIRSLNWPADVVEQWLYDHGGKAAFLQDYGGLDLSSIVWDVEIVPLEAFLVMPTGPSDSGCIEEYAGHPDHWVRRRTTGIHRGVPQTWEAHGTWKRWPLLLDRRLLEPSATGLQVVEGRTRVGVLRGRRSQGSFVAPRHLAWVGRPASSSATDPAS
ncbi:hypothetical protein ACIA49_32925 [Kribbella sp. NPDC051587]|uniref:hypothetical protein n=1 Tax=Kribbella sp. NPDC051587 TaxID=3364119 RepID=UPI0037B65841